MHATASCSQARKKLDRSRSRRTAAPVLGVGLAVGMVSAGFCSGLSLGHDNSITTAMRVEQDSTEAEVQSPPPIIVGAASTYNPYRPGYRSGGAETASGELYDPTAWTAAIQLDLREQFGGVRYGRNYRPTYALVECAGKRAIVKINDVGPLKPGRVIDLNERSMRYCDPSMQIGVINDVKVVYLQGENWTPGPTGIEPPIDVAAAQSFAEEPTPEPIDREQPITASAEVPTPEPVSEQPINIVAEQSSPEVRTPEPIDRQQPMFIVAAQSSTEVPTPEPIREQPINTNIVAERSSPEVKTPESIDREQPITASAEVPTPGSFGSEQPTNIAAAQSSVEEPTPEPIGSGQPTIGAAVQSSADDRMPGLIDGHQLTRVTAAPYRYSSHKVAAISLLVTAIAVLLKRASAAPAEARGAGGGSASRRRTKSRRKGRQKNLRKSQRKDLPKNRRKDPRKSRRKTGKVRRKPRSR
jgi:peptidoglycan lytic transglycosylase